MIAALLRLGFSMMREPVNLNMVSVDADVTRTHHTLPNHPNTYYRRFA